MRLTHSGKEVLAALPELPEFPVRLQADLTLNGSLLVPEEPRIAGETVFRTFLLKGAPAAEIRDTLLPEGPLLMVERTWRLLIPGAWSGENHFSMVLPGNPEILVPAVMYRDNLSGSGAFPREAGGWSFLETRTPLPSCAGHYAGGRAFFCCTEPARSAGSLSSAAADRDSSGAVRVTIRIPGREFPAVYAGKKDLVPAVPGDGPFWQVESRELPFSRTRRFYLYADAAGGDQGQPFGAYARFVEALEGAEGFSRPVRSGTGWKRYAELKTIHLLSLTDRPEFPESAGEAGGSGEAAGTGSGREFCLAMGRRNGALQEIYDYTAGSFLVKSLEGAAALARAGRGNPSAPVTEALEAALDRLIPGEEGGPRTGMPGTGTSGLGAGGQAVPDGTTEEKFWTLAEGIGRFFLRGESAPGVHQDCYDLRRRIWGGYLGISEHDAFRFLVNARCNGEVMLSYLRLYELSLARGRAVPEFLELPRRVARFYLKHQLKGPEKGSFGRWWQPDGNPEDTLGTNGAYIASFLCSLEPHDRDNRDLARGILAAGEHYRALALRGEFFGDTLDADSCDKESGAALLALFMDLYERDRDPRWLEAAAPAAEFLVSWTWQYDCWFPGSTPLGSRGFQTSGMTSVSVAHHHLDFYGMALAWDFLRYAEAAGRGFFRRQAVLMLSACRQLVADRKDLLGRGEEDLGWQPEQINHAGWDYFGRPERSTGHFDIDIAWVTVLGLGAWQKIRERYPEILEERGENLYE